VHEPVLTASEMFAWSQRTADGWRSLLQSHPEALEFPCDIYATRTVAGLLQHIVAVELRFAQRLAGLPETPYEDIPSSTLAEIFGVHDTAFALLRDQLAAAPDWSEILEFRTRTAGTMRVSRKTILIHVLMHSIRHYAQLATLVRSHGIKPGWQMDYLVMGLEPPL